MTKLAKEELRKPIHLRVKVTPARAKVWIAQWNAYYNLEQERLEYFFDSAGDILRPCFAREGFNVLYEDLDPDFKEE